MHLEQDDDGTKSQVDGDGTSNMNFGEIVKSSKCCLLLQQQHGLSIVHNELKDKVLPCLQHQTDSQSPHDQI